MLDIDAATAGRVVAPEGITLQGDSTALDIEARTSAPVDVGIAHDQAVADGDVAALDVDASAAFAAQVCGQRRPSPHGQARQRDGLRARAVDLHAPPVRALCV